MIEFLETTIDKFVFRVATDRLYCQAGVWVFWIQPQESNRVRVGITDFLQQHGGDMAFVTVKPLGTVLQAGDDLADLETMKATMTLAAPVSGTIVAVNEALELNPELINQSPYEKGWLAELDTTKWEAERAMLLAAQDYFTFMRTQAEEEVKKP